MTTGSRPRPQAGKDYPKDDADFLGWFPDDAACLDYLDWLRWPDGFSCPDCSDGTGWRISDGRWWCKSCRRRISATAGTIFHRTKTPLTIWFSAGWSGHTRGWSHIDVAALNPERDSNVNAALHAEDILKLVA